MVSTGILLFGGYLYTADNRIQNSIGNYSSNLKKNIWMISIKAKQTTFPSEILNSTKKRYHHFSSFIFR